MQGLIPASYSLFEPMLFTTTGLKKAINTEAKACIPRVPEKTSTPKPSKKEEISNNQPEISKGKSKIKYT
jgi:hypothetical protein